ncbi:MAG: universal stress protein [Chitinophagales bacterium]|nr:universal stress protein [Chitinophagales bacterium]MDW8393547.1 universal stress protein [Chitinophagales bacterium]
MSSKTISVKKVLVPTDFSDLSLAALDYAAHLARAEDAELLLLHVVESYPQNTGLDFRFDFTEIIEKGIQQKFQEIQQENTHLAGVRLRSQVAIGKIHSEIDRVAAEEKVRLIVMGTQGVSGITNIGKFVIGSNAYRTIQNAPCPIITLRQRPKSFDVRRLLVPLDSTPESTQKIDVAIRWAKYFGAKIQLLAVTAFFEELVVDVRDITRRVHEVERQLADLGIEYEAHIIRHQAPSESVLEFAEKTECDMIFIVTGQESALSELLFGSSARNIISESPVPVMSINIKKFDVAELEA